MASFRKRGKKFVAEVRVKGAYRSKTFLTKAEAQRWALDIEQRLGRSPNIVAGHTLGEAMARFAREITPTHKSWRSEENRIKKISRDALADITLDALTPDDLQAWIARQTISDASINRDLNVIGSVLRVARVQWKWMSHSPMRDVVRPKQPPPRDRLISEAELERILLALEYDEKATIKTTRQKIAVALLLALETAMRQGEIWGLDWQHIHLKRRFLTLPETKNGTKRDVALSRRAVALLEKLSPASSGRVLLCNQASAGVIFRRCLQLAEIEGLTFHDSRHTAITNLARKIDVLDLARMVGHRDIRSLQAYYNATAEDIATRLD
jgi:integrase